jgi:hypothetical protein
MRLKAGIQSAVISKPTAYILGQGLWNDLEVDMSTAWLHAVLGAIKWKPTSKASILLVTPNAAGKDKDDLYVVTQGNKALVRFEEYMAAVAKDAGVEHLGTWNMVSIPRPSCPPT